MKPYRSMLFVPGHKPDWADKAIAVGADALILDLEDAVADAEKVRTRSLVRATIQRLHVSNPDAEVWVRTNSPDSGMLGDDLEAIVAPGISGVVLPKVSGAREVLETAAVVAHLEHREGLVSGSVELIIPLETASAFSECEQIAALRPRVASILGGTGPHGDPVRSIGYEYTP